MDWLKSYCDFDFGLRQFSLFLWWKKCTYIFQGFFSHLDLENFSNFYQGSFISKKIMDKIFYVTKIRIDLFQNGLYPCVQLLSNQKLLTLLPLTTFFLFDGWTKFVIIFVKIFHCWFSTFLTQSFKNVRIFTSKTS